MVQAALCRAQGDTGVVPGTSTWRYWYLVLVSTTW